MPLISSEACQKCRWSGWQLSGQTKGSCTSVRQKLASQPWGTKTMPFRDTQPGVSPRSVKLTCKQTFSLCYSDTWCCQVAFSRKKLEDVGKSSNRKACTSAMTNKRSDFQTRGFFQHCFLRSALTKRKKGASVTSCIYSRWFIYALYPGATTVPQIWCPCLQWDSKTLLYI